MRMIAIHAQTERKRLDRSVRCAEKRRPWARKQRLRGLIRPDPAVCATAGAACGRKSLSSARIQAIFTSNDTPLGECRLKEPPLNRTNIFFGESHSDWLPVRGGESGDFVFRRGDGHAFAKIAPASRRGELAGERDRLIWLKGRGVACPEVINWQEEQEGACLVITAIPGVPAADLSGADLLKAWPSMGQQLGAVHSLSVDQCPFERRLSRMFGRAVDVVSRNAVNPDFLPDEDKSTPQLDLLARVERELPVRLDQERTDMVVCHGDPCMPNFMVDPKTLQCTGLIDLGRLGTADRYADLALMIANAEENWAAPDEAERAFAVLFNVLGIEAPDRERLAFYLRLDPLTWG